MEPEHKLNKLLYENQFGFRVEIYSDNNYAHFNATNRADAKCNGNIRKIGKINLHRGERAKCLRFMSDFNLLGHTEPESTLIQVKICLFSFRKLKE